LLAITFGASDAYVEGQGWFLFGGNELETSQKLVGIDSSWEQGPKVNAIKVQGQCAVKVIKSLSELSYIFIGSIPTSIENQL